MQQTWNRPWSSPWTGGKLELSTQVQVAQVVARPQVESSADSVECKAPVIATLESQRERQENQELVWPPKLVPTWLLSEATELPSESLETLELEPE